MDTGWNDASVASINCREQLPLLLNQLGLCGVAVEVGVEWGRFSDHILRYWQGRMLYSVDPWDSQPLHRYSDLCNVPPQEQEVRFRCAGALLASHGPRSRILRAYSVQASQGFPNASIDCVYLDGNHAYQSVMADLANWYPKMRPGGLMCGHDYVDGVGDAVYGVKSAVDLFFSRLGRSVHVTREPVAKSWLVRV
ncbi:class I SAM-dependent methyltransferase [Duganella sp. BJB488]|uniref:class I SAM-dependent methyltransferase n=1 Tax=unclassified Duganella TaxID=2636909 RepID=UPI000E34AF64|nr:MULTISPECIES: class I SAM-dependent methyltransferase [unclassified Duganella]RFP17521.1 class I SAM-dependent methyltransferase [Duganella sp. BJB489]RFP22030.1 class I SAM-dependent methyltransferase [Duganella sp. BJB488]RFP37365.1 class I SAM-dependent methyltransferase [Duganella sp. BJB480]